MRKLITIMAFAGGLIGLGNYVWDGWTVISGGRDLFIPSNVLSIFLLATAASASGFILLRERGRVTEEERKEYQAAFALSALSLAILISWILFRALRRA